VATGTTGSSDGVLTAGQVAGDGTLTSIGNVEGDATEGGDGSGVGERGPAFCKFDGGGVSTCRAIAEGEDEDTAGSPAFALDVAGEEVDTGSGTMVDEFGNEGGKEMGSESAVCGSASVGMVNTSEFSKGGSGAGELLIVDFAPELAGGSAIDLARGLTEGGADLRIISRDGFCVGIVKTR